MTGSPVLRIHSALVQNQPCHHFWCQALAIWFPFMFHSPPFSEFAINSSRLPLHLSESQSYVKSRKERRTYSWENYKGQPISHETLPENVLQPQRLHLRTTLQQTLNGSSCTIVSDNFLTPQSPSQHVATPPQNNIVPTLNQTGLP